MPSQPVRRTALVCALGNPLSVAWLAALRGSGHQVVVVDLRDAPASAADLEHWAVPGDVVVLTAPPAAAGVVADELRAALGGEPEVVLGWWGRGVLDALTALRRQLPHSAVLHVVDTFPDASGGPAAVREVVTYRNAADAVDGWVFYSERMRRAFVRRVPAARSDPWVAIWEAFGSAAFSDGAARPTGGGPPTLVYSGRTDLLWGGGRRMAKDAMGPFLVELERLGVRVIVSDWDRADVREHRFQTYPRFSNAQLLDGTFAQHMDTYDVQLVAYAEANRTLRRRVSTGLSTRLASAITSTTPVAISRSSTFIRDEWARTGQRWGFAFGSPESLASRLHDRAAMAAMREAMAAHHRRYALDLQMPRLEALVDHALRARSASAR